MACKVAAIQMVSAADTDRNLDAARRLVLEAARRGARLAVLPEVFAVLEGGPMRRFGEVEGEGPIQAFLSGLALEAGLTLVGGTIPLISRPGRSASDPDRLIGDGRVRAACLVFDERGRRTARYDKMHLFDVTVDDRQAEYSESRSYEAGSEVATVDTPAGRLGLSVCYDLRFPELYRELCRRGAQIVAVPSAFTRVTGEAHWESLLRARAIENQCYVIAAGQGGRHSDTRETWGHSMVIDPWGEVLAGLETGEGVAVAEADLAFLESVRRRMPVREHRAL